MEHALPPRRSCDLHVHLRDDPTCAGEHSPCSRAALVLRLTPATTRGEAGKGAVLGLSMGHSSGLLASRHAPILTRCADAACWRASSSVVADALAAAAVSRCSVFHVLRLCGRHDDALLPDLEASDGHGSS